MDIPSWWKQIRWNSLFNSIHYNFWEETWKYKLVTVFLRTTSLKLGHVNFEYKEIEHFLHPKMAVGGSIWHPFLWFSKNVSSKERVKRWFFVTFNIIIRHIFPKNFIEILLVVQTLWRISLYILAIFINYHQFFRNFWHFIVTKKLMTSAYNKWCQHFFTFNIL